MKALDLKTNEDMFGNTKDYVDELDLGEYNFDPALGNGSPSKMEATFEPPKKETLGIIEGKSFFSTEPPPIDWLIEGVVEKKNVVMMAGAPKTAKSWMAIELGICVATGRPLFGDPLLLGREKKGSVLFCFLEDGHHNIHSRVTALARSKGVSDIQELNMMFRFGAGIDMGNAEQAQRFGQIVSSEYPDIDLIVFDPFRNLHYGDENNSGDIIKVMENLRAVRDITGAAILVIHHTRKPSASDKNNPGFAIRGSGAIFGAVDGLIALSNVEDIEDDSITNNVFIRVKAGKEAKPFSTSLSILDGPNGRARVAKWKVSAKI